MPFSSNVFFIAPKRFVFSVPHSLVGAHILATRFTELSPSSITVTEGAGLRRAKGSLLIRSLTSEIA